MNLEIVDLSEGQPTRSSRKENIETKVLIPKPSIEKMSSKDKRALALANYKAATKAEYKEIVRTIAKNIKNSKLTKKYAKRFYYGLKFGSDVTRRRVYAETKCYNLKKLFDINGFNTKVDIISINGACFYELTIDYTELANAPDSIVMNTIQNRINKMISRV